MYMTLLQGRGSKRTTYWTILTFLCNYVLAVFKTFSRLKTLTCAPTEYITKKQYKRELKVNKVKKGKSEYKS